MSLVDVGCGPGRDSKYWSDRGVHVVGIDVCREMIERAKLDYPEIEFRVADILSLDKGDIQNVTIDCCWMSYLLLHLPPASCRRALNNVRRIVRPNGVVFIATSISSTSRYRLGPIAGLTDSKGAEIDAPTYEWSLDDWKELMDSSHFLERWSRLTDFMSGKATILSGIYSLK
jgi:ubiquinone/menaquinone biosynthesis C-methylase UbiE